MIISFSESAFFSSSLNKEHRAKCILVSGDYFQKLLIFSATEGGGSSVTSKTSKIKPEKAEERVHVHC